MAGYDLKKIPSLKDLQKLGKRQKAYTDAVGERVGTLEGKLPDCVQKEEGKGLSANDFTDAYKQQLDSEDTTIQKKIEENTASDEEVDAMLDEVFGTEGEN